MRNCKRRPRPKLAHRSYHPHCVAGKRFSWCKHSEIGYNYRLSNVLAAIGRGQLRVLDQRVQRKREIFAFYRGALADRHHFWPQFWGEGLPRIGVGGRETIRLALEAQNIESRPLWKPMHLQPVFQGYEVTLPRPLPAR
ncbi:DegT/DnrJ/EryC1/StrS family aminotransferase [Candidatus Amarolinea dominans]|uniref:DegT/DnrJ/EryC1/StrS family aminotransferase n=1 Tax=Candidatus Amarolinea dominans TaxID=3140696 RepID=UPI0031CC6089